MADWYCGSVQYAAVAQFAISHAYSIGDIVRQLAAPAVGSERCFRCTTAGTSGGTESAWTLTKAATTTQGTAVFTEVTGNATYNWAAPHARLATAMSVSWANTAGDRVFVAHNHAATQAAVITITNASGAQTAPIFVYCVNASGSVPPASADLRTTATETTTGGNQIAIFNASAGCAYFNGIQFVSSSNFRVGVAAGNFTELVFENCSFTFTGGTFFQVGTAGTSAGSIVRLVNTPIVFSAITQGLFPGGDFIWKNTPSAIGAGSVPTTLINNGAVPIGGRIVLDGLDLSAVNTTIVGMPSLSGGPLQVQIVNCKLNASATVAATASVRGQDVLVVGSGSAGNSARNEKYALDGTMTTETTIVRTSGASDGTTPVSWKAVTTANPNKQFQFELPPLAIWNASTGASKTVTVEIVNDGTTLNTDHVWIEVEYLSDGGDPLASVVSSRPSDHLASGSAITTSTATWTTTGLTSPVKQKMSVSFTPQIAGLVRVLIRIAKQSQTLYVDPKVTIS